MEPVGLTIGLVSLFTSPLTILERITAAKTYGEDYHLFVTKVNIERLRLFRWGQTAGLIRQHKLLNDPEVRDAVTELLAWGVSFFGDVEGVKQRYGRSPGRTTSLMITSALNKLRWALSGKKKSEKLLQELTWFVDKLHELIP
ncbi:hypothetical protein K440DRAFT_491309, partial [Wilcoxina mikolae CBS 423.85]